MYIKYYFFTRVHLLKKHNCIRSIYISNIGRWTELIWAKVPLISIKSLSFIQSYSSGTVNQQQPFPSFPAATPLRQGFLASEECHSQVIHCANGGLSFQTECVCVCVCVCVWVNVRATAQYKSTEGSLVSGLMEEWMTNKNSEMPFIVASWVCPFLFSFYDFLNLFSPQGHPPPFLLWRAAALES